VLRLTPPSAPGELPEPAGPPKRITNGQGLWRVHNGGWSPDAQRLVYTRETLQGDIYVIENYQ